jgi:RimK family alpha-L-glutamate ligase
LALRIGIVSTGGRHWQANRLRRALSALAEVELVDPARLRLEVGGGTGAVTVWAGRGDARRFHAVVLGRVAGPDADPELQLDGARALELVGVPTLNRVGPMLVAQDKLYCAAVLAAAGLPTPTCSSVPRPADVRAAVRAVGAGAVAKPLFGSLGEGLFRLHRHGPRRLRAEVRRGSAWLAQRFVPTGGVDYRLFVVGDRVEACVRREVPPGDFRSNEGLGARMAPEPPRPAWGTLAVDAVRALGLDFGGVDLALEEGRPTVLEVNGSPGYRALFEATGCDMSVPIARRAAQLVRARRLAG